MTMTHFRVSLAIDKRKMEQIHIKRLDKEMLGGVAEIEKLCFCCPWSENALELLLTDRAVGFAAVGESGKVYAYGGMLTVLDEGEITNIATHPDARRKGFGRAIVSALIEYCIQNGLVTISLEVRESNMAAVTLYEGLGFERAGIRKNFYTAPLENAIVMIKNI